MAMNQAQIEITATDKTRAAFDSVNNSLGKIKSTATSVNSVLGAFGAASVIVGATASFAKSALGYADSIGEIAQANDVAISKVLELNQALIVSGGSSKDAGTVLAKFSQYINKAVEGSEDARDKLKKLGISLEDLKNKSYEGLFDQAVDGMSKISDKSEKTATKLEIFGKSTKNINLTSLNENLKKAKGTQDEYAKSVEEIAARFDRLDSAWSQFKLSFAVGVNDLFKNVERLGQFVPIVNAFDPNAKKLTNQFGMPDIVAIEKEKELSRQKKTAAYLAKEAEEALAKIEKDKANRQLASTSSDKSAAKEAENFIDKLKKQVATYGESKSAALEYEAGQAKLTGTQRKQADVLLEQIKVQEALVETQIKLSASYGDLTSIFTLNSIEKSNVEILQAKLNLMTALPDAIREAAQAELDLAKATEQYNALQSAQNIGTNNEIEQFNELYDAEKQSADERDKLFADTSEQLKRENEDLNVSLITSDKKRAKAQLDLEHQRSLDRINGMMLEGDEAQRLIDQETQNYELRKKQIDQTNNITKELGLTFSSAFEEAVVGGKKFTQILQSITQDIAKLILRKKVTEPLFGAISDSMSGDGLKSFFGGLFNANGNAFNQAGVMPFANGGVFTSPQMFSYGAGNLGVLGEAGAEAILPLKRSSSGKLGVMMEGANGGTVNNISIVVNSDGSNRTEQGGNELGRRIESAVRGVLMQEKRPGGMLA